jgi:TPR repeat protein
MEQLIEFANNGDAKAQTDLGRKYHLDTKEFDKAIYWYGKAVEEGNAKAQNNLGLMYLHGQGVEQD